MHVYLDGCRSMQQDEAQAHCPQHTPDPSHCYHTTIPSVPQVPSQPFSTQSAREAKLVKISALIKALKFNAFHGTLRDKIICQKRSVNLSL